MFINVRGTFGSGKTTAVRHLIEALKKRGATEELVNFYSEGYGKDIAFGHRFVGAEGLKKGVIFVGHYGTAATGGADTMSWKGSHNEMEQFIRHFISDNHMVIEGSIASGTPRYAKMALELKEKDIHSEFLHLDSSLELCLERIKMRRTKKNELLISKGRKPGKDPNDINVKGVQDLLDGITYNFERTKNMGLDCGYINSEPEVGDILFDKLLKDEGNN